MREPKILFVEDDAVYRESITRFLSKRLKGSFASIASGAEACQILEKESFDLILTDYKLDSVNGLKILSLAKQKHPDTILLVISGIVQGACTAKIHALGGYFIAKPIEPDLLLRVIERHLSDKGGFDFKKI